MKKLLKKLCATVLALCFAVSTFGIGASFSAAQTTEERKAQLEQQLAETDKKLKELGTQQKDTQEYLNILDEKLNYSKEQLKILKSDVKGIDTKISSLESNIDSNSKLIVTMDGDIAEAQSNIEKLNQSFAQTYDSYCKRMRAMYISGNETSILSLILGSTSLQNFFTRLQMISAISKRDGELLKQVKQQTDSIILAKNELSQKQADLEKTQNILESDKSNLKVQKSNLSKKQEELADKEKSISAQQIEANELLQDIANQTKEYGELHEITQEELDAIDDAIALADKKYQAQTTTTTTTTTKKPTTTKPSTSNNVGSQSSTTTTTTTSTTTSTTQSAGSQYIRLTYPVPSYKTITCGYGDYYGHTGCDFSYNGNTNVKVVAAESGIVILSTDIYCDRSTCTKKNHGDGYCSYGRYIVIRHDKTTSKGDTVYTLYAHNSSRSVSAGQHVEKGQQIALGGSTGNSTGPHCHFEVRVGGSSQSYAVNPASYLS